MTKSSQDDLENFISRWQSSGAAERANYQMFLSELCDILGIPRPDPTSPDPENNRYVFDRAITRIHPDGSAVTNFIDFYKAAHFVWETKQGVDESSGDLRSPLTKIGHGRRGTPAFDKALERAYHQARDYITHLPAGHSRPPFLIVCDVGHSIDLYTEFTCTGGRYERFPDPINYRILHKHHRPPALPRPVGNARRCRRQSDWLGVEPSIFGTLLTRALDSRERHKLGAEYTPRSYVERLIRPTILDPLRE